MKKQKAILFDWDGVLAKRKDPTPIWDYFKEYYGLPVENVKSSLKKFDSNYQKGLITNQQFWQSIASELEIKCDVEFFNKLFFSERELNIPLLDASVALRNKAYIGIVSNNFDIIRDEIVKNFGNYFDGLFFSCDTGYTKPSKEPFKISSDKFGINLDDIAFVDDDIKNLEVLTGTGIYPIHFKWLEKDKTYNLLNKLNDWLNKND